MRLRKKLEFTLRFNSELVGKLLKIYPVTELGPPFITIKDIDFSTYELFSQYIDDNSFVDLESIERLITRCCDRNNFNEKLILENVPKLSAYANSNILYYKVTHVRL